MRVVVLELVEPGEPGLRRLLEQGRAGQRVSGGVGRGDVEPAGEPGQRQPWPEQRAGHGRERDQQQDLAVGGSSGITNAAARVTTPRMPAQPRMNVYDAGGVRPVAGRAGADER